jgi:hypothetical protein
VFVSSTLPAKTIIAIVPAGLATVVKAPRIEASIESAVHMYDPATDLTTPGTPPVSAYPIKSIYQTDSVALRLILPATWALRSPSALAWVQNVTW